MNNFFAVIHKNYESGKIKNFPDSDFPPLKCRYPGVQRIVLYPVPVPLNNALASLRICFIFAQLLTSWFHWLYTSMYVLRYSGTEIKFVIRVEIAG